MRIGIDAKAYTRGPVSGRTYLRGLLHELERQELEDNFIIFVDAASGSDLQFANPRIHVVPVRYYTSLFTITFQLPRLCKKHGIDVLITQYFTSPFNRSRQVVIIHDILYKTYPSYFTLIERLYFIAIKPSCKRADLVIADSEFTQGELIKYQFADKTKTVVIPVGISPVEPFSDEAINYTKEKYDLAPKFFLYVGRLNDRKNIPGLLKAFSMIQQDITHDLIIVGKPDWKYTQSMLAAIPYDRDRVRFLGFVDDNELEVLYNLADALVYVPFVEGFGLPPLEAMSFGTPVITSNTGSLPEVVGDGGVLISPHNIEEIAGTMKRLAVDRSLRKKLSHRASKRAQLFSWSKISSELLQAIKQRGKENPS